MEDRPEDIRELEEKSQRSYELARNLVEHVRYEMGADGGEIPVSVEDEWYTVTIERGRKPEPPGMKPYRRKR